MPVNNFQSYRYESSWVEPALSRGLKMINVHRYESSLHAGNFFGMPYRQLIFLVKINFSKILSNNTIRVKQFGSRSGPTFRRACSGSKQFAMVTSRQQKYKWQVKIYPLSIHSRSTSRMPLHWRFADRPIVACFYKLIG